LLQKYIIKSGFEKKYAPRGKKNFLLEGYLINKPYIYAVITQSNDRKYKIFIFSNVIV